MYKIEENSLPGTHWRKGTPSTIHPAPAILSTPNPVYVALFPAR